MLYKKKKPKFNSNVNHSYIGVIETAMMYKSDKDQKEYLISVFTLFVEEPSRHLILIRFYEDFIEFDRRIKSHVKRFRTPLPKLIVDQHHHGLKKKLLSHLVSKYSSGSNAYNLEIYLRYCMNDATVKSCSLFKEFLQPQREEDNAIPKNIIQSIVNESIIQHQQQQQQQESPPPTLTLVSSTNTKKPTLDPILISNTTLDYSSSSFSSSHHQSVTIQDFQFIKVIGRGCMGKVLLVRHKNNNRLHALKAISKKKVIEQSQITHIKAEQQILTDISSIYHPFLIRLHYSFQDRNQLFLVFDYHVGGDLATQLRLQPTLPPERCQFYVAEIILGIQELHRLGILYRDLKPENILLTADGHLVLTDFGLSKQFYDGLSLEDQRTNTFCGTAEYLAPEILNDQPYSYEVDYWSLGTVLYEMLIGITPFWAQDRDVMYERIRHDDLVFPEEDYLDEYTIDFIAQLLTRDPAKRLGSSPDGAIHVRSHPYFMNIDWEAIYTKKIPPPYIPPLYSETDMRFFESEFLCMTPRLSPVESNYTMSQSLEQAFEGYSYVNREPSLIQYNMNSSNAATTNATRYFENEQVVLYDDYSMESTDDIRSIDLVRDSALYTQDGDEVSDYFPPRPARPVVRDMSFTLKGYNRTSLSSSFL